MKVLNILSTVLLDNREGRGEKKMVQAFFFEVNFALKL